MFSGGGFSSDHKQSVGRHMAAVELSNEITQDSLFETTFSSAFRRFTMHKYTRGVSGTASPAL